MTYSCRISTYHRQPIYEPTITTMHPQPWRLLLSLATTWLLWTTLLLSNAPKTHGNETAKRLYEKLLHESGYNRHIRPVSDESQVILVRILLKMAQIIDVVSIILYNIYKYDIMIYNMLWFHEYDTDHFSPWKACVKSYWSHL